MAILSIAWLPLVILTAVEGSLYASAGVTFLNDIAIQARLLIVLPMLVMIRPVIDRKVIGVLKYLANVMMDAGEKQVLKSTAFRRFKAWTNSVWTEVALLLLVIAIAISFWQGGAYSELHQGALSWMATTQEGKEILTMAGGWAIFISFPIFQLIFFRWLWKYFVWVILLFRLSKAQLNLRATHPDHAGGLGVIILAQSSFSLLFVAGSVLISGELIASLLKHPESFTSVRNELVGFVILCLIMILVPLLFFMGKLVKIKQEGLVRLSTLGVDLSSKFEAEWVNELPLDKRIAQQDVDPSMLHDYGRLYDSLQQFRIVPMTLPDLLGIAIPLILPFIPILFVKVSAVELLQKILKMLV